MNRKGFYAVFSPEELKTEKQESLLFFKSQNDIMQYRFSRHLYLLSFFNVLLGIELRASHLLGRFSNT
jgi:hypothetical protein